MSAELGRIAGKRHPITVSVSRGGVELGIWEADNPSKGFGDGLTPEAARGLATLLERAAALYEERFKLPEEKKP